MMLRVMASKYALVLRATDLELLKALNSRKLKTAYSATCFISLEICIPSSCSGKGTLEIDEK